jgi:hypothetical protein
MAISSTESPTAEPQSLASSPTQTPLANGVADVACPPCDLDSDEPPVESYHHFQQLLLLLKCLDWLGRERTDYFTAGNLTVYYSARKLKSENFRGLDFFVVLNTEKRPRKLDCVGRGR